MRKRNWVLVIVTIVIIVALIFVITLSNKNKNLGFFSDDSRQVSLVKELYENILNENLDTTSLLNKDTSLYINFITYKHYVISNENSINEVLSKYVSDNKTEGYTLSNAFDLDTLTLSVTLKKNDNSEKSTYKYKLKKDKKQNKISYKLLNVDHEI